MEKSRKLTNIFIDHKSESYLPLSWHLDPTSNEVPSEVIELIQTERNTPVVVNEDLTLRAKVIDMCGLACEFCHNEGTPVKIDNTHGAEPIVGPGRSGRVSIFVRSNGVDFLPGRMEPDNSFTSTIYSLKNRLGFEEIHFTGGEPTLHSKLDLLSQVASGLGYKVKFTSNGENGRSIIRQCAEFGLTSISFSIFGTNPEELASTQGIKYKTNLELAERKIAALKESISIALDYGINVSANIVMQDSTHAERVLRLLDNYDQRISVRLLNSLDFGASSYYAIYDFLYKLGARPNKVLLSAGSSTSRVEYEMPNGRKIYFKQIRPARLHEICNDCSLNNPVDCKEGYYGLRLYVDSDDKYKVGFCIQRMDYCMDIDDFLRSELPERIVESRQNEFKEMTEFFGIGIIN